MIAAGRVQVDFWDSEDGYYLNGTYYGDKNLLAIGVAGQVQGSDKYGLTTSTSCSRRSCGRRRVHGREPSTPTTTSSAATTRATATSDGGYVPRRAILFPQADGLRASSRSSASSRRRTSRKGLTALDLDYDQKTTEFNFNYVIKEFNARVMFFYKDTRFNAVKTELQAGRRRPPAADVTRVDSRLRRLLKERTMKR